MYTASLTGYAFNSATTDRGSWILGCRILNNAGIAAFALKNGKGVVGKYNNGVGWISGAGNYVEVPGGG